MQVSWNKKTLYEFVNRFQQIALTLGHCCFVVFFHNTYEVSFLFLEPWAIRPGFGFLYCGVGYLPSTILLFIFGSYRMGFTG